MSIIVSDENRTAWTLDDQWTAVVQASGVDAKSILAEAQADGLSAHDALLYLAAAASEALGGVADLMPVPKIVTLN